MSTEETDPGSSPWHCRDTVAVAAALETDTELGLSDAEAARRLAEVGENRLEEPPPTPAWRVFARQFAGVLPLILGGASVLALWIGEHVDAAAILVVLIINGVLGFVQERRAERALAALKTMLAHHATVHRDGRDIQVPASQLVPGDLVHLATGDRIPADGRLTEAHALAADESVLTGVEGQLVRSGVFRGKAFTEALDVQAQFKFILNPDMTTNGRFPTVAIAFDHTITPTKP